MNDSQPNSSKAMSGISARILALLGSGKPIVQLINDIVLLVQKETEMECVGLRLADGPDFPYYFTRGFGEEFVKKEMYLCARDLFGEYIRDSVGNPVLECMCGNVICGRTDMDLPFFSEGGSFFSNCTTQLLATTSEKERQARTRNRCNGEGYESVALVPIKVENKCLGLLQLNDQREGMFTPELISFLEGVAGNIGLLFSMVKMKEQIASQASDVNRAAVVRGELLARLAKELRLRHDHNPPSEREKGILEKIDAILSEVETLKGIVPICSVCKRVRIDPNYWTQVEAFIQKRNKAQFTHTYCPECFDKSMAAMEDL